MAPAFYRDFEQIESHSVALDLVEPQPALDILAYTPAESEWHLARPMMGLGKSVRQFKRHYLV